MNKIKSPYTASITGGGFLFDETAAILPLLLSENRKELLEDEKANNRIVQINAETSRKRSITEIERRFDTMPLDFWYDYMKMEPDNQKVALWLVILKTYKILFDLHINVTMRKWNSITKTIFPEDLLLEFNEISAKDDFVDSWTEGTKKKISSSYLTILRKIGMLDRHNELHSLVCSNYSYYLTHHEAWFLNACLLQPYEIENIKNSLS